MLFHHAFTASPGYSTSKAAMLTGLNCWQIENAGTHGSIFLPNTLPILTCWKRQGPVWEFPEPE